MRRFPHEPSSQVDVLRPQNKYYMSCLLDNEVRTVKWLVVCSFSLHYDPSCFPLFLLTHSKWPIRLNTPYPYSSLDTQKFQSLCPGTPSPVHCDSGCQMLTGDERGRKRRRLKQWANTWTQPACLTLCPTSTENLAQTYRDVEREAVG